MKVQEGLGKGVSVRVDGGVPPPPECWSLRFWRVRLWDGGSVFSSWHKARQCYATAAERRYNHTSGLGSLLKCIKKTLRSHSS